MTIPIKCISCDKLFNAAVDINNKALHDCCPFCGQVVELSIKLNWPNKRIPQKYLDSTETTMPLPSQF